MGGVGVGTSHKHFVLQPGQAGEIEQGMSLFGCPKSSLCRKQAPLKPFLSVCIPTTLSRKLMLLFFCSLLNKYSDSAIPCFGQEWG